jgi:hypothetical protein
MAGQEALRPVAWKKAYPETPVQFIQPKNFMDFLI